jgi:hypothetical protein
MESQQYNNHYSPTAVLGEIKSIRSEIHLLLDNMNEAILNEMPLKTAGRQHRLQTTSQDLPPP